jgi:hypothetical protein
MEGFPTTLMFKRAKKPAEPVIVEIAYQEKISRFFIFRVLWVPAILLPFIVYGLWFSALNILHVVYMLLLGERSRTLFDREMEVIRYYAGWQAYLRFFTNARPAILL